MRHWIKAFRLRTLPLSFSNILFGSALAYSFESGECMPTGFNRPVFALTLLTTLLLQVLSNLANDYGDAKKGADNENRIGPDRAIQSGAISAPAMLRAIIICSILTFLSGIGLLYAAFGKINYVFLGFVVLGLLAIAAAIKYTMGKRAYGYHGMGDLFVFIFFGWVGVAGTFYLQTHYFGWWLLIPATTMGCFSVAVLNLNNMRDQVNDKAVRKNTLVVRLGRKNAKIYHGLLFVIAYLALIVPALADGDNFGWYWLPIGVTGAIHVLHLWKVYKICDPKDFDPELKKIALSALLFAILFWVATILEINT
jgi:1,4-dihydroxy-2-naphthoate polyprenyltransferase